MTTIRAEIYDFGHDQYGNPTSHFTLWEDSNVLFRSKRRVQCGYVDSRTDGAQAKIKKLTGKYLHLVHWSGHRSDTHGIKATFNTTKLEDRVYTFKNRVWGKFIAVKHDDGRGYHDTTVYTQDHCDVLNERQAITPAELKAVELLSMSGKWGNYRSLVREFS